MQKKVLGFKLNHDTAPEEERRLLYSGRAKSEQEGTATKEQTSTGINDANSILASGMVTCVFFSTFLIFLHFSLLYFVFIYSFRLFIFVAFFLVVKTSAFSSQIAKQLRKRHKVTSRCVQPSIQTLCTLWSDTVEEQGKIY